MSHAHVSRPTTLFFLLIFVSSLWLHLCLCLWLRLCVLAVSVFPAHDWMRSAKKNTNKKTHNKEWKTESGKLYDFRKTLEETTEKQMCDSFNVRNSIPEYHHQISVWLGEPCARLLYLCGNFCAYIFSSLQAGKWGTRWDLVINCV